MAGSELLIALALATLPLLVSVLLFAVCFLLCEGNLNV